MTAMELYEVANRGDLSDAAYDLGPAIHTELRKPSWLTERLQDPPLPRLPSAYKIYPHTRQEDDRVACPVRQRLDEFGFCISPPSVWGESKTADEDDTDLRTSSSGSQTTSTLLMCASLACGMGVYALRQQSYMYLLETDWDTPEAV